LHGGLLLQRRRDLAQARQRCTVVGAVWTLTDRSAVEPRQQRGFLGVVGRGRLCRRGGAGARFGGGRRCDTEGGDQPDRGRRRHRERCDTWTRRHVTPFRGGRRIDVNSGADVTIVINDLVVTVEF